jgi:hypothetical protein
MVKDYACDLTVFGRPLGHLSPGSPLTVPFARGNEYLIECKSSEIGVKLYARQNLYSQANFANGALPSNFEIVPVAVLPNLVKAAAGNRIEVATTKASRDLQCEVGKQNPKDPWADASKQIVPAKRITIPMGVKVTVLPDRPIHCGDTNLILVNYNGQKAWFPNRDFIFTYKSKPIGVFPPSQDRACCWIE